MAMGSQGEQPRQMGPSAEQMAIAQMGQFAQQPNSLAGILSSLNALTAPTMNPNAPASTNVLVSMPQAQQTSAAAHVGGSLPVGAGGSSGSGSNPLSGVSSQQISQLGKTLSSLLSPASVPTGMAGTALGGAGLPSGLTAAQQANLSSAFSAPAVSGSVADAIGLTPGALAPLTAAELAPVGTGAVTAAGNAAGASAASELSGALGTSAAPAAAGAPAAAASAPAASSAGGMGAGALAADAGALSALGWMGYNATHGPANNGWSMQAMQNLTNNVRANTASGLISPAVNGLTAPAGVNYMNPNGTVNTNLTSAVQGLQQMQLGDFGPMTPTMQGQLNNIGYQGIQQAAAGKTLGAAGGAVSPAAALLRRRF